MLCIQCCLVRSCQQNATKPVESSTSIRGCTVYRWLGPVHSEVIWFFCGRTWWFRRRRQVWMASSTASGSLRRFLTLTLHHLTYRSSSITVCFYVSVTKFSPIHISVHCDIGLLFAIARETISEHLLEKRVMICAIRHLINCISISQSVKFIIRRRRSIDKKKDYQQQLKHLKNLNT